MWPIRVCRLPYQLIDSLTMFVIRSLAFQCQSVSLMQLLQRGNCMQQVLERGRINRLPSFTPILVLSLQYQLFSFSRSERSDLGWIAECRLTKSINPLWVHFVQAIALIGHVATNTGVVNIAVAEQVHTIWQAAREQSIAYSVERSAYPFPTTLLTLRMLEIAWKDRVMLQQQTACARHASYP